MILFQHNGGLPLYLSYVFSTDWWQNTHVSLSRIWQSTLSSMDNKCTEIRISQLESVAVEEQSCMPTSFQRWKLYELQGLFILVFLLELRLCELSKRYRLLNVLQSLGFLYILTLIDWYLYIYLIRIYC